MDIPERLLRLGTSIAQAGFLVSGVLLTNTTEITAVDGMIVGLLIVQSWLVDSARYATELISSRTALGNLPGWLFLTSLSCVSLGSMVLVVTTTYTLALCTSAFAGAISGILGAVAALCLIWRDRH